MQVSSYLNAVLKHKAINAWGLFWLISVPISVAIAAEMFASDLSSGDGVSHMISYSVRYAVPLIFMVVASSSLQILFPGPLAMWWLRNRKYLGLCFAVAMAWQGLFIFMMSYFFRDYYYADVYLLRDEIEGSVGYIFLAAMVLTSFRFGRSFLSQDQWRVLHKTGLYFLWAYPFSVYWWNSVHYYGSPAPIDHIFYWMGFAAFALRIAAWGKQREKRASCVPQALGGLAIAAGLIASASGQHWQKAVSGFLGAPQWSANLELWFPYWPFEPFLSLLMIGFGVLLLTKSKTRA
jgi:hypothetical protein